MSSDGIMRRGEGFEFEIPYIDAVHFDQFPGVMAREALIAGQRPPALDEPFVYCDMGCGTGATILMLAASFPESHFYGVDLSADHIDHAEANRLATGIENATFFQGSFERAAQGSVPPCDFISAHGILSWIPEAVETELLTAVQSLLKPSGLFQLSANLQPGWGQMSPLRQIMRHHIAHAEGNAEDRLLTAIGKTAALVSNENNSFGGKNPDAKGITGNWRNREAAYVGHEMLGGAWRHFSVGEVMRLCKGFGLECCGPLASAGRLNGEKIASFEIDSTETETLEDFMSFSAGEGFRSLVFTKPENEEFERSEMELLGDDVLGFPVFARWSVWAPEPKEPLSEWTLQFDDQPHYLARIMAEAASGAIPGAEFAAVAHFVGSALMARNALIYADTARDVETENCSEFSFEAPHPLTAHVLAQPRTYRYGGFVPSPILGGGVSLSPVRAALLGAFLDNSTDKLAYARAIIAKMDAKAPPWALEDPDRALPDPADEIDDFTRDWLPFLLRLGVIQAQSV